MKDESCHRKGFMVRYMRYSETVWQAVFDKAPDRCDFRR